MTAPVRRLHLVWTLDAAAGGLPQAVVLVANAQARAGEEVVVATLRGRDAARPGLAADLDPTVRLEVFAPSRWRPAARVGGSLPLVRWLLRELRTGDVVHLHGIWDAVVLGGVLAARWRRVYRIVSPHGALEPYHLGVHGSAKRLLRPGVRALLRRCLVHATSERESRLLVDYCRGIAPVVVPLPTPPAAGCLDRGAGRRELDLDPEARAVLFLGRVDPKKGLDRLIEAVAVMPSDVHLLVAGRGEDCWEAEIRALATAHGVEERVIWLGWVSGRRKAAAWAAADVFALPSLGENFGVAVMEAAAAGVPVVASADVGAAVDLAARGGAMIAATDPASLAEALETALCDGSAVATMVANARAHAERAAGPEVAHALLFGLGGRRT